MSAIFEPRPGRAAARCRRSWAAVADEKSIGEQLVQWGKVALLETRGRTTGRVARAAVGFVGGSGGDIYLAAGSETADWALNLRAEPACRARIGDETLDYEAAEIEGSERARALIELILKYGTPAERLGRGPVFRLRRAAQPRVTRSAAGGVPQVMPRRIVVITAVLIAAVIVAPSLPPIRSTVLTAALVPEMLAFGPQPLSAVVPEPLRTTVTYGTPGDRMDVYLPAGSAADRRLPAVVLELGVHPQPIDHPDIVRVVHAIGRLGVVVAVPDSTALRNLRVTPAEPAHLADAVLLVAGLPEVDPQRVGLAGFSAGGSIALVAAADERIAGRLRYVSSFGGYADAERLLVDVATRTSLSEGEAIAWQPDPGIRRDVLELSLNALTSEAASDELVRLLTPVVGAETAPTGPVPAELATLTGDARQIYLLFTAPDRRAATAAVEGLSARLRAELAGISPLTVADRIRAPVFLLHGQPDTAIPVAHAALVNGAVGDEVMRLTRFGSFGHEQPGTTGLGLDDASDVFELSLYLRDIVAAATE